MATMLRSPRNHVLSQFIHCSTSPEHKEFLDGSLPSSFKAWVSGWAELHEQGLSAQNWGARRPFSNCFRPIDLQSHHLTCESPRLYAPFVDTNLAIRNMRTMWFVGLQEYYRESLCLFQAKVFGFLSPQCDCENETAWNAFKISNETHGSARIANQLQLDADIDDAWEIVDKFTASDQSLYFAAEVRFFDEIYQIEQIYSRKILCKKG
eukprot:TRINITY_DN52366_c0_g1_i1.p1 TRINITY_DN52366_c0_g1~~TRINITY_DN52366_c0_g1_i1.p1  ORF type:complete len:230 (+),score=35.96 TRINITY_DN52366_c0_g1_i1:69-692(+)